MTKSTEEHAMFDCIYATHELFKILRTQVNEVEIPEEKIKRGKGLRSQGLEKKK